MFGRRQDPFHSKDTHVRLTAQADVALREFSVSLRQAALGSSVPTESSALESFTSSLQSRFVPAVVMLESLPPQQVEALSEMSRRLFRGTDPMVRHFHETKGIVEHSDVTLSFSQGLEGLFPDFGPGLRLKRCDVALVESLASVLASSGLGLKKAKTRDLEQHGVRNTIAIEILRLWTGSPERRQLTSRRDVAKRYVPSEAPAPPTSRREQAPLPWTARDLLGETFIGSSDGLETLRLRSDGDWHHLLTDAYLAFQVGEFDIAELLYEFAANERPLPKPRSAEHRIAAKLKNADPATLAQDATAIGSESRLAMITDGLSDVPLLLLDDDLEKMSAQNDLYTRIAGPSVRRSDQEVVDILRSASLSGPLHPGLYGAYAMALQNVGDVDAAISAWQHVIATSPVQDHLARIRGLESLATLYLARSDYLLTQMCSREALRLDISSYVGIGCLARFEMTVNADPPMFTLLAGRMAVIADVTGQREEAATLRRGMARRGPEFNPY